VVPAHVTATTTRSTAVVILIVVDVVVKVTQMGVVVSKKSPCPDKDVENDKSS
jgi:hypothetical protein